MEDQLTIVLMVLLILFIIYILIQKSSVCSIVRNEREDFSIGAQKDGEMLLWDKMKAAKGDSDVLWDITTTKEKAILSSMNAGMMAAMGYGGYKLAKGGYNLGKKGYNKLSRMR